MAPHTKTGIESVIEMFRVMEPSEAERLLANLAKQDPGLVEKIRANLFVFADLAFKPTQRFSSYFARFRSTCGSWHFVKQTKTS